MSRPYSVRVREGPPAVPMGILRYYDDDGREMVAIPLRLADPSGEPRPGDHLRFMAEATVRAGGAVARQTYTDPAGETCDLALSPDMLGRYLDPGSPIRVEGMLAIL